MTGLLRNLSFRDSGMVDQITSDTTPAPAFTNSSSTLLLFELIVPPKIQNLRNAISSRRELECSNRSRLPIDRYGNFFRIKLRKSPISRHIFDKANEILDCADQFGY